MNQTLTFKNKDGSLFSVLVEYRIKEEKPESLLNGISFNADVAPIYLANNSGVFLGFDILGNFNILKSFTLEKYIDCELVWESDIDYKDLADRIRTFLRSNKVGTVYDSFKDCPFQKGHFQNFKTGRVKLSHDNISWLDSQLKKIYGREFYFKPTHFFEN